MLHANRRRAESFGGFAEDYDRLRPSYPEALVDAVCGEGGKAILDVGCGTGKAARLFLERGCSVLGIEIDERMAEIARRHGVEVEVASFEDWQPRGRNFDIITSGQAWHWVDPAVAPRKAAEVLREHGRLSVFWNYGHLRDPELEEEIQEAFEQFAPELAKSFSNPREWRHESETNGHKAEIEASGAFGPVQSLVFAWEWSLSPSHWLELQRTHSDIALLPEDQRRALLDALSGVVGNVNGDVVLDYATFCLIAEKAPTVS